MKPDRAGTRGRDIGFVVILAIQIALIFVLAPLAATVSVSARPIELLRFALATTTILIIARHPALRLAIAVAFGATLLANLQWTLGQTAIVVSAIKIVVTIVFDSIVSGTIAFAVIRPGRVTIHRIIGAIILYLYIALTFAEIYRLLVLTLHPAFDGLATDPRTQFSDVLYFSLSALTTGSSGTIVAVHPFVRSLSSLESVIGQLFPATLLARLVTLHVASGRES